MGRVRLEEVARQHRGRSRGKLRKTRAALARANKTKSTDSEEPMVMNSSEIVKEGRSVEFAFEFLNSMRHSRLVRYAS